MDGLARAHLEAPAVVIDHEQAREDERVLVELGRLGRLLPALRALHPGDADRSLPRVHAADVLLDRLRKRTRRKRPRSARRSARALHPLRCLDARPDRGSARRRRVSRRSARAGTTRARRPSRPAPCSRGRSGGSRRRAGSRTRGSRAGPRRSVASRTTPGNSASRFTSSRSSGVERDPRPGVDLGARGRLAEDPADPRMDVLDVVDGVLARLLGREVDVDLDRLVVAAVDEEPAGEVDARLVHELVEEHDVAAALATSCARSPPLVRWTSW